MSLRIGHGMDAHRLVAGRPLMLGCVTIPTTAGSPAIPTVTSWCTRSATPCWVRQDRATWAGISHPATNAGASTPGTEFLHEVSGLLAAQGMRLVSAQVVVIAEEPRLAPYLEAMSEACAAALGAPRSALQVTATSSDGLGFAGRGEGIGASAVVLLDRGI